MIELIPELKYKRLTIDFWEDEDPPVPDQYIVSVGKNRKPGSVYQIVSARKVKSTKYPRRWALQCLKTPDMLQHCRVGRRFDAYINDVQVISIVWNPRKPKKGRKHESK